MANNLKFDTRALNINWATGTSYTISLGSDLVKEVGNNRSPSAAQPNVKTFVTFDSGPVIESVNPAYGTTGSFVTTASIAFNRPVFIANDGQGVRLYKENLSGSDELIATISTSSTRVSRQNKTLLIDLRNLLDGSSTYYLDSDDGNVEDMFKFNAELLLESNFKYSTAAGPQLITKSPSSTASNVFISTATLSYNRTMFTDTSTTTNSVAIFNANGSEFNRLYTTSSAISIANTTLNISFLTKPMPEGEYYITMDKAFVRDQHTFPAVAQTATDFLRVSQTSISNMTDRQYLANVPVKLFSTSTVLDVDLDSNKQYTFTLTPSSGTFIVSTGTTTGGVWSYTATKAEINNLIDDIEFSRVESYRNNDITYTYSLSKDGTTLVNKTQALNGIPMSFAGTMTLVPPSQTLYQLSPIVNMTATITPGSSFTGEISVISTTSNRRNVIFVGNNKYNVSPINASGDEIDGDTVFYSAKRLEIEFQNPSSYWPYGLTTSSYEGFVVGEPLQIYSQLYDKFDNYIITEIGPGGAFPDPRTRFYVALAYDFGDTVEIDPDRPGFDTWYGRTKYEILVNQSGSYPTLNDVLDFNQGTYESNSYQGNFFNPKILATTSVTGTNAINYSLNPELLSTTQTNFIQSYWTGGVESPNGNKFIGTDSNIVSYNVSTATVQLVKQLSGGVTGIITTATQTFVATWNTTTNGLKTIPMYLLINNDSLLTQYTTTVGNSATWVISPGFFTTSTSYTFRAVYPGDAVIYSSEFEITTANR